VKNTFLESAVQLSPSLENFYQPRAMHTCPSKRSGCITSLLEEMPCDVNEASTTQTTTPLAIQTPCSMETLFLHADAFRAHADVQTVCELPVAFSIRAMPTQVVVPHEPLFGGAGVALHAAAPPSPASLLVQRRRGHVRPVLNLADALGSEALLWQQKAGVHLDPQPMMHQLDGFGPGKHLLPRSQTVGATTSNIAMNLCAPPSPPPPPFESTFGAHSHPPPPPAGPALGSEELPSVGSSAHAAGCCRPCAFLHTKGCESGLACKFCHLCGPEVRKCRRQEKLQERRAVKRAMKAGCLRAAE